jgi:aspartate/methionine/tyrosine aminotransferase
VKAFCDANPEAAQRLIRCGIGDVTEPLPLAAIAAMHRAVDEMAVRETFKGYGPEQGYEWLRAAIAKNDFRDHGCDIAAPKFLSVTAANAIRATSSTSSATKTKSPSATRFIRFMWTRT